MAIESSSGAPLLDGRNIKDRNPGQGDNPLLTLGFDIPFGDIRPEHVEPAATALLAQARERIEAIENDAAEPSYDNTLGRLDTATEALERAMGVVGHLEAVMTSAELRDTYNRVRPELGAFYASIALRPKLWERLKAYAATPDSAAQSPARARYLKKTMDDFRRNGAELAPAQKQRLEAISRELSELTSRYSQNVVQATGAYELIVEDLGRLRGLPEAALERAKEDAAARGKSGYRLTLQAPSLIPVLTYVEDAALREELYSAFEARATQGEFDNRPLILKILELRREQAELLGYGDFADLVLEDRMAHTGKTARRFVEDLTLKTRPAFEREREALREFRTSLEGPGAPELRPWDLAFYSEKQRQALYDFDAEELRPFFPIQSVIQGLFETARRLYGVRVEPNAKLGRWHPDVLAYDLYDADGTFLSAFYADFHPRDEKRDGAWMDGLIATTESNKAYPGHLGLICANVTPPSNDRPALLSHMEVETLFHEFGHLLHLCLSKGEVRALVGTNVAWDFVELPSQIMENFCWEREALGSFARHYQTGAPIGDDLFGKMQRARTYREATAMMRQLGFASVDLALHIDYDPKRDGDVLAYARRVMQDYLPAALTENYAMVASFSHLFSSPVGYAAGYYSYKWAEVLDADAFTRFKREGVYSRTVGEAFRRSILERGDSADPMELYTSFMGREPSLDALLERSGLKPDAVAAAPALGV
jgi:oligopeptidase A